MTGKLIKKIGTLCWTKDPLQRFQKIKHSFLGKPQERLLKYVERVWLKFSQNNMLNYTEINQQYRANSILEGYNARIKKILPYKPNIALFLEFIVSEENYFTKLFMNNIKNGEKKLRSKNFGKPFVASPKIGKKGNKEENNGDQMDISDDEWYFRSEEKPTMLDDNSNELTLLSDSITQNNDNQLTGISSRKSISFK